MRCQPPSTAEATYGNAVPQLPPTPERMWRVVAGTAEWTAVEEEWLLDRPHWIEFELCLRAELLAHANPDDTDALRCLVFERYAETSRKNAEYSI